jgi:hypothetical protein
MWERPMSMTPIRCKACESNPVWSRDKDVPMYQVSTLSGGQATVGILICRRCDRV